MFLNQLIRHVSKGDLQVVGVDDHAAEEGARTAWDRCDALGDQAASAAFSDRQSRLTQTKVVKNDLLEG